MASQPDWMHENMENIKFPICKTIWNWIEVVRNLNSKWIETNRIEWMIWMPNNALSPIHAFHWNSKGLIHSFIRLVVHHNGKYRNVVLIESVVASKKVAFRLRLTSYKTLTHRILQIPFSFIEIWVKFHMMPAVNFIDQISIAKAPHTANQFANAIIIHNQSQLWCIHTAFSKRVEEKRKPTTVNGRGMQNVGIRYALRLLTLCFFLCQIKPDHCHSALSIERFALTRSYLVHSFTFYSFGNAQREKAIIAATIKSELLT